MSPVNLRECAPVDTSDDDAMAAMKAMRGYIDITPADFREVYRVGYANDTVILTAGCAKYRYNKLALGDIGGIPRVLDAGQCNDSYSLAVIASKFKEAFGPNNTIHGIPFVLDSSLPPDGGDR